jgi:hypothetical protein
MEDENKPIDSVEIYADMHQKFEAMYPRLSQKMIAMTVAIHFIEENLQLKQDNNTLQLAVNGLKASRADK